MKRLIEKVDGYGMPFMEGYKPIKEAKESFLPDRLVMVDLEMTGVVPERDEIIQIAMVKLKLEGIQYVEDGEPFEVFPHTTAQPSNGFHEKFLKEIFKKANESTTEIADCGPLIEDWLGDWKGKVMPTGDCVPQDMMFLYANGILTRGDIVDEKPVSGTFHYEFFEIEPLKATSRQKTGKKEALDLDKGIHNAMVDCRNQTKELNHYLSVLLS
jgi:oligoribonuclease (3'-5' exoribonuclease)